MIIKLEVSGGTHRLSRATMSIEGEVVGEIQIERSNFTKFCDLIFKDEYSITSAKILPKL